MFIVSASNCLTKRADNRGTHRAYVDPLGPLYTPVFAEAAL